jgi:hypothetical protein
MKIEEVIIRLGIGLLLILLMLGLDPVLSLLGGIGLYLLGALT